MPGFHHSIAVLPLPFHSAIPLCHSIVLLPFFRSVATAAVAGENGNTGNVWLYVYGRMAKIGFYPIATEQRLWRNGR